MFGDGAGLSLVEPVPKFDGGSGSGSIQKGKTTTIKKYYKLSKPHSKLFLNLILSFAICDQVRQVESLG